MRKSETEATNANNSSVVEKRHQRTNLNDVLNFIVTANRLEKRAIDLALNKKNSNSFELKSRRVSHE